MIFARTREGAHERKFVNPLARLFPLGAQGRKMLKGDTLLIYGLRAHAREGACERKIWYNESHA